MKDIYARGQIVTMLETFRSKFAARDRELSDLRVKIEDMAKGKTEKDIKQQTNYTAVQMMTTLEKLRDEMEILELSMRRLKEILGGEKMKDPYFGAWRSIKTAPVPLDKLILMWWLPLVPNHYAEACVVGLIPSDRREWWNPQLGTYQDLEHITHWMPLPEPPEVKNG